MMCPAVLTPTRLTNRAVLSFLVTAMIGQLGRNWAITNAVLQIKKKNQSNSQTNKAVSIGLRASGCQGDDGRSCLLEGSVHRCHRHGLNSGRWLWYEGPEFIKHIVVKHGRLCLQTDLAHDGHSFRWVLP